jgi:hypothetical protein
VTTSSRVFYRTLLMLAYSSLALALPQEGKVSSSVPGSGATAGAANELPWRFLASPAGVLNPSTWPACVFQRLGDSLYWDSKSPKDDCNATEATKSTSEIVRDLITVTIGSSALKPPYYVVLHILDYAPKLGMSADAWYVYRSEKGGWGEPKWRFDTFTRKRIYGSHKVLFLFVHLNAKAIDMEDAQTQLDAQLQKARKDYKGVKDGLAVGLDSTGQENALRQGLADKGWDNPELAEALARVPQLGLDQRKNAIQMNALDVPDVADPLRSTPLKIRDKESGDAFRWLGQYGLPDKYDNTHYESAVVKRTPANLEDLMGLAKILGLAQGAEMAVYLETKVANVWGAGSIDNIGLPSDISIAGYSKDNVTDVDRTKFQLGTVGAFNDEQLYWWDASIGIPVHKIKDLQYSSSDNTIVASQVDKQSAYAMFNLMPLRPVDLSDPKSNVWPRFLVGFPLSSSPWDRLFAGGSIGLPWGPLRNFQFFVGATFNRSKQPATLSPGSTASDAQLQSDLKIKTIPKFTFGINVPVKSVLGKLTK